MMKQLGYIIFLFFLGFLQVSAKYNLELGSQDLVNKYHFSQKNLEKPFTKKEFVETLYEWYDDYKGKKGIKVDYQNYKKLDHSKYFKDVSLESDFGKKLQFFASQKIFMPNEYFSPQQPVTREMYIKIMKRIGSFGSVEQCKKLKICEKEANDFLPFTKGSYYTYTSKILDPKLRKNYSHLQDYVALGYQPYLDPNYPFPIKKQTLNGCYAFTVRNILKYSHNIGVYVPKVEGYIKKSPESFWNQSLMAQFDEATFVKKDYFYDVSSLVSSLQSGKPVGITYILEYPDKFGKIQKVRHIVAAYSFDKNGVYVAETVANKRVFVPFDKIFFKNGQVKISRMFSFAYIPKKTWSEEQKSREQSLNFLLGEK